MFSGLSSAPAGLSGHEEEVVRVRGAADRGEEVVAEHVVLRPRPVVRDRRPLELRVGPRIAELPVAEPVVRAAVHVVQVRRPVVGDVAGEPVRARRERHLLPELHPDRRAVRAGEPAVQVVEAPVLHHHVDRALDRPARVGRHDGCGRGRRHHRLLAAAAGARDHRRARQRERGRAQERTPREQRRLVVAETFVRGTPVGGWIGVIVHGCPSYQATPRTISFCDPQTLCISTGSPPRSPVRSPSCASRSRSPRARATPSPTRRRRPHPSRRSRRRVRPPRPRRPRSRSSRPPPGVRSPRTASTGG